MTRAALLALAVSLAACGAFGPRPDTSHYYTLAPLASAPGTDAHLADLALGLGPVSVPEYLERPALVTRVAENEIELSGRARWAEPLDLAIERTLVSNLSALLGPRRIATHPWPTAQRPDLAVAVDVLRFELDARGDGLLSARFALRDGKSGEVMASRETSLVEPAGASGTDAGVAALSRALAALSREIADAVRAARAAP